MPRTELMKPLGILPSLPFAPRPVACIPIDLGDGRTAATLVWEGDGWKRCRMCPRELCGAYARGGGAVCMRVLPGRLSAAEAAAFVVEG